MNPNQALWEKRRLHPNRRHHAGIRGSPGRLLGITPEMQVLDLGCGDGTTALPIARRGAQVTGIDIARNLVEAGNRRAAQEGLENLHFQEGDACDLQGVADQSFDLTVSIFGAMFAPKPFEVAQEMVRVTKKGGRVVMGNWIPGDPTSFVSQLLKISSAFTPPPPEGFVSPMLWGVEANVKERFGAAGIPEDRISTVKDRFTFIAPGETPEQWIGSFRKHYGPTMNAYDAAEKSGRVEELHQQLVALAESFNQDKEGGTLIAATFLRVTVQVSAKPLRCNKCPLRAGNPFGRMRTP